MKQNISKEDYTLMKINEALEKNVWHVVTPEYLRDLDRRWEIRQKEKMKHDSLEK